MKNNTTRKTINVDKPNLIPLWTLKQEDDVILKLALFKEATPFNIAGQTIKLGAKTLKGLKEQIDGFTIKENELDIALKNSILVPGLIEIDLEFKDAGGKMTSTSFFINVNSKVLNDVAVKATNEFDTFTKTVTEIEKDYQGLRKIVIDENNAANLQDQVNKVNSSLEHKVNQDELEIERKRIDLLTKVQNGETEGNTELLDIRVGADAIIYDSAGESVRKQFDKKANQSSLDAYGLKNVIPGEKILTETNTYFNIENAIIGKPITVINNNNSTVYVGNVNLLNIPNIDETTINGITYSIEDGILTLNGTSTTTCNIGVPIQSGNRFSLLDNESYTFTTFVESGSVDKNFCVLLSKSGSQMMNCVCQPNKIENITTEVKITGEWTGIIIYIQSNITFNNFKCKMQIEIGSKSQYKKFTSFPVVYSNPINFDGTPVTIKSSKNISVNYYIAASEEVDKVAFKKDIPTRLSELENDLGDISSNSSVIKLKKGSVFKNSDTIINPTLSSDNGITNGIFFRSVDIDNKVINDYYRYSLNMKITSDMFPKDRTVCPSTTQWSDFTIEFLTDAIELSVAMSANNSYCSIMCDGELITEPFIFSGSNQYAKITFTERKVRTIKLLCQSNSNFFGVVVDDRASIFPYSEKRIKACFDGDSIVEGAGSNNQILNSTVGVLSQIYNFDFYDNARGGTGYSNDLNGTKEKMIERIDNIVLEKPDVIIIMCGLNDNTMLENATVDIPAYFNKLKELFPTKEIIIVSPFSPQENASNIGDLVSINNLCKNNALLKGYPYIDTINGITYDKKGNVITSGIGGIIKGNGTVNSPVNGGNRSIYMSSDGTHPVAEGHKFIANRIAEEINKIFNI